MGIVIVIFFAAGARYIFGHSHDSPYFFLRPFYDPQTFKLGSVLGGGDILNDPAGAARRRPVFELRPKTNANA